MKLHLGCGAHFLKDRGWTDTDIEPKAPHVMRLDASRAFPFESKSFSHVFSEHMIEHIPHAAGQEMLHECYRVLQPGGRIRISCPDLAFLIAIETGGSSQLQSDYLAFKKCTPCVLFNDFMREGGLHQFIYDGITLARDMSDAGFASIKKVHISCSDDIEFQNLEWVDRMPPGMLALETMTLEGSRL